MGDLTELVGVYLKVIACLFVCGETDMCRS